MLDVVYRPRAAQQIDAIADYTIAEWGQAQARHYVANLRRQIEFATEFPGIGSSVTGLPEDYRKIRSGSHRVIYRVANTRLIVVRIIHEREDVPNDLDDE
ncbi:MAG: type II toxin-antitoxin system RelE/ParE family toxin [Erythrobacter sp.]|nr:type II toxin-antitoxin system RelE/ParE family toxin [Erythrobacter sp.]